MNRRQLLDVFHEIANIIESHRSVVLSYLNTIETYKTAQVEVEKTVRALRTYQEELPLLEGRIALGSIA